MFDALPVIILIVVIIIFISIFFGGGGSSAYFGPVTRQEEPSPSPVKIEPSHDSHIKSSITDNALIKRKNPVLVLTSTPSVTQKSVLRERGGKSSQGESICRKTLENYYGVPFPRVRPTFLRNPDTGRLLELDCYNAELKIACEYNGIQHNIYPNWTGCSKEKFLEQVKRDQLKWDLCNRAGVYLITVPHTVPLDRIEQYVISYLPQNYKSRLDAGLTE